MSLTEQRLLGYGLELPCNCEFKFQKDKFSCGWFEEKLYETLCNVMKKKHIAVLLKTLLLSRSVCDLTIKTEPIFTEIFLILFTVRLREVILDPTSSSGRFSSWGRGCLRPYGARVVVCVRLREESAHIREVKLAVLKRENAGTTAWCPLKGRCPPAGGVC